MRMTTTTTTASAHCAREIIAMLIVAIINQLIERLFSLSLCCSAEIIERGHQQPAAVDVSPRARRQHPAVQWRHDRQEARELLQGCHI